MLPFVTTRRANTKTITTMSFSSLTSNLNIFNYSADKISATAIGTALSFLALIVSVTMFSSKSKFDVNHRTVLITGGSQGLGLALAHQLASKGANVVIVAQTVSKLERATYSIQTGAIHDDQKFTYLSYDLRDPKSAPEILKKVTEWNDGQPPDVVLNCAGLCVPGFFAGLGVEEHRGQMDTVYWSCAYLAHATLKAWTVPVAKADQKKHDGQSRHLIFTSSVVAFLPMAGYAAYTPAKAAMRALADTLNQEVQVYNGARQHPTQDGPAAEIKVHAVFPMGIKSPGFENENKTKPALTKELEKDDKPQDPKELAKIIIDDLEGGRYSVSTAFIGHIMKGWGLGGSQRVGLSDYLYNWLGSIAVLFVAPDMMSKCFNWGKKNGLQGAT